jgi:hypothetical protein
MADKFGFCIFGLSLQKACHSSTNDNTALAHGETYRVHWIFKPVRFVKIKSLKEPRRLKKTPLPLRGNFLMLHCSRAASEISCLHSPSSARTQGTCERRVPQIRPASFSKQHLHV